MAKSEPKPQKKVKLTFVSILAIVSIIGFLGVISKSLFDYDMGLWLDALILLTIGVGFIIESRPKVLKRKLKKGLDNVNFSRLITFVLGSLAVLSGVLSFPFIDLQHFVFLAIKGVISIIVIIFIVIQTWVVNSE